MNPRLSIFYSLLFTTSLWAGPATVTINVHPGSENKTVDRKAVEETRAHWLDLRVTNTSGTKLEGLTLKWKLYAANLQRGHDDILVEKSGDMSISVDPNGHFVDVTTPKVPFTWSPQHSEKSGSSRRTVYKRIPEEGHRYHGYFIQVMSGDTVVGEAISNESLRQLH